MMLRYAGFWRRWLAALIDGMILNSVSVVLLMGLMRLYGVSAAELGGEFQLLSVGAYATVAFPYYTLLHFKWGCTLGKRMLGVRVVDAETGEGLSAGQAIGRTLALPISYLPLGFGFLMAAWDSRKRALHDRLCSTVCIRFGKEA